MKIKIIKTQLNNITKTPSSPSLDKVIEPVYDENNKKRRKRKRNNNKNKVNKSVQFQTQVSQPASKPVIHFQQLFSLVPLLGRTLYSVKVKFKEELDRRALIDTGPIANVISREFYKELINTNIKSITKIEKPDLDIVKMANGNIVKIDKAINVTFKFGTQTLTEDFLVLTVTTPVILGHPFFVKRKNSICPVQSYIKFPDQTLQINEIRPEKQPRRRVKRKKFGVYTQKKQVLQTNQQANSRNELF